ncbi:hypothetical protein AGMMS49942_02340 [Spirochaetia bacterium]|nr:hypothetical protein AGMMS49942_02340 [Spirochaetia bacterium]
MEAEAPAAQSWSADVPPWYLNPPEDDGNIYGIGSAKLARPERSQSAAENRARTSLAFQLEALVDAMETDYYNEAGTIKDAAVAESFEAVSRQLASARVSGAKVTERKVGSDGTVYALVAYSQAAAKEDITKRLIETAASKNARIKTDAVLKAMDEALKNKSSPEPVDTGGE